MNLINANHGDAAAVFAEIFSEETLWCDEQNLDLLSLYGIHDGLFDRETLLGVDASTRHKVGKFAKLVSHQRD